MTVEQKAKQLFEANPHLVPTWEEALALPPFARTVDDYRDRARRAIMEQGS